MRYSLFARLPLRLGFKSPPYLHHHWEKVYASCASVSKGYQPFVRPLSLLSTSLNTPSRRVAFRARPLSPNLGNMCRANSTDAEGGSTRQTQSRELLPANVVPTHYHVTLEPQFEELVFSGTVAIDLDVAETSSFVSLNTLELEIQNASISSNGAVVSSTPKISTDTTTQVTKFEFDGTLNKGDKAKLEIKFTGELNDKMAGFYRSTFKREDGSEGILATTQMEPSDCRRAFPCFDEPSLKAKFTVTLIADKDLTCLSNMDQASETEVQSTTGSGKTKKAVTFNTSPAMSTYLVAFIVGELNYIETKEFRVPVRVYAPPGQDIEHGRFSLDLAAKTLAFYEKVFGIDFPLPKMDQVAIPDFAQGAMENWGLVTYRVVDLLLDQKASGAAAKERVAEVVQHELAHQWFGNLVTMDWWEGLWLNEGFATWASWVCYSLAFRYCLPQKSSRLTISPDSTRPTSFTRSGRYGRRTSPTTCSQHCRLTRSGAAILSRSPSERWMRSTKSSTPSPTPRAPVSFE